MGCGGERIGNLFVVQRRVSSFQIWDVTNMAFIN